MINGFLSVVMLNMYTTLYFMKKLCKYPFAIDKKWIIFWQEIIRTMSNELNSDTKTGDRRNQMQKCQ